MNFQKTFILLKVGKLCLSAAVRGAIDVCFESSVLSICSYKGKTKKKFTDLQLFTIIYGKFLCTFSNSEFHHTYLILYFIV